MPLSGVGALGEVGSFSPGAVVEGAPGLSGPLRGDPEAKHEAGFGDRAAFEIYPPDREVLNVLAMRHLHLLPVGADDYLAAVESSR